MRKFKGINPLVRAVGVFSAVAVVVGGVTYAVLNSQATLTGNTFSSSTSDLQVYDTESGQFAKTGKGFDIKDFVPGKGADAPFYLKNKGGLDLDVSAHIPTAPAAPEGGYGFASFADVKVTFTTKENGCSAENRKVETTMQALLDGEVDLPCNSLKANAQGNGSEGAEKTEGNYKIKIDVPANKITGDRAQVNAFDLVFSGTPAGNDEEENTLGVTMNADPTTATVGTSVNLSATVMNNTGSTSVQFYDGATPVGSADASSPYSVAWDTTGATAGAHNLTAKVTDANGNKTSDPVVVTLTEE